MKTEHPIVLTIFGNERCVTSLADLEAAAKAIHQKAVRESQMSVNPSTLGAEIDGQNSLTNAEFAPSETQVPRT
jgi:hypothetical protein